MIGRSSGVLAVSSQDHLRGSVRPTRPLLSSYLLIFIPLQSSACRGIVYVSRRNLTLVQKELGLSIPASGNHSCPTILLNARPVHWPNSGGEVFRDVRHVLLLGCAKTDPLSKHLLKKAREVFLAQFQNHEAGPESKDTKVLNMYNIFNLQKRHCE
jgi:hypothetical protein